MARRPGTKMMEEALTNLKRYLWARYHAIIEAHYSVEDMAPNAWDYPGQEELLKWRKKQGEALEWLREHLDDLYFTVREGPLRVKRMFIEKRQSVKLFCWHLGPATKVYDEASKVMLEAGLLQDPFDLTKCGDYDIAEDIPEVVEAYVGKRKPKTHFKNEEEYGEKEVDIEEAIEKMSPAERIPLEEKLSKVRHNKMMIARQQKLLRIMEGRPI